MSNRLISKPAVFGEIENLLDSQNEVFFEDTKEGLTLPERKQKFQRVDTLDAAVAERKERERKEEQRRKSPAYIRRQRIKAQKQNDFINNSLRNNQYQSILDKVIDRRTKLILTQQQANRFFNSVFNSGRYTIHIKGRGLDSHYAFNNASKDFIISILMNGARVKLESEKFGSDALDNVEISNIRKMTLKKYEPTRRIENRDASFFPYLNTGKVELSRYQIYTQEQAEQIEKREHCLIESLKLQGVTDDKLNQIKLAFVSGVNIKKSDLPTIADIIKRDINLYFINGSKVDKKKIKSSNPQFDDAHIAIHSNHYFVFEKTNYSTCSIKNYDEVKDEKDFHNITRIQRRTGMKNSLYRSDNESTKMNSLLLVDKLHKIGVFKKEDMSKFEETASHIETRQHIYLDNIAEEQIEYEQKEIKENKASIYYADCESFTTDSDHHELYLLGFVSDTNDTTTILNTNSPRWKDKIDELIDYWMTSMTKKGTKDAICYFHNLKYDYTVLEKYLNIQNRCEKDGSLYNVKCIYKKATVELRDSFKLLPFALSKFANEFDLPSQYKKKEAIAYDYYNKENDNKEIKCSVYREFLSTDEVPIFDVNVKECLSYVKETETFNPTSYYMDYLNLDCLVLKKGLQKFNVLIGEITKGKMCIYDCLTISSLTDKYMTMCGAYDGVYEVKGNLRAYIGEAVYGGRVCVNKKYEKKEIDGKISDYDGVSLYPSAINRLCRELGLPKGAAKRFQPTELNTWKSKTYSILTVKITSVNKEQQMPFIAHKSETSIEYLNEAPTEPVIIDSITLEDYIKFHDIEYEILDGVYWNSGTNKKMGDIIQELFNARLQAKEDKKNALSNVIKLMLNSAYGKTIMKKTKSEKVIVKKSKWKKSKNGKWEKKEDCNLESYIYNNFNTIKSIRPINDDIHEIERIKADDSYNRAHIGCAILSTSKRIMNEVFDVANDNEYPIYYTDTDSLHCNLDDVPKLEAKYEIKYGKKLNGKNLEQFHTDFKLKGAKSEIYATKSIFLGKKSYMDYLESKDAEGEVIHGFHIRLKGITEEGLDLAASEYKNSYIGLYQDLAKGIMKKMVLNPYNKVNNKKKTLFEFKDGKVKTRPSDQFIREVKF